MHNIIYICIYVYTAVDFYTNCLDLYKYKFINKKKRNCHNNLITIFLHII